MNALEENYEAPYSNYGEPALNCVYTYNADGQLQSREFVASDTLAATELLREYDGAGHMRSGYERQGISNSSIRLTDRWARCPHRNSRCFSGT